MLLRIQIVSSGTFLVLQQGGVLTVDINSTLFNNQDVLLGSFSYPGKMPLEPNRAAIQNAHLIATDANLRSFYVRAWLGAMPWTTAKLNFTIDGGTIVYNLVIDNGLVARKLKNLKISQLADPNIDGQLNFANAAAFYAYLNATVTATPGTVPMYFFPWKNDGAYKTIEPGDYSTYPDISFPLPAYINAWQINGTTGAGEFVQDTPGQPVKQTNIPAFTLVYILKRIALLLGYQPTGHWLTEESANRICIPSNIPVARYATIADYYFYLPATGLTDFFKEVRTRFGLFIYFDEASKTAIFESISNLQAASDVIDLRPYQLAGYRENASAVPGYHITQPYDDKDTAFSEFEKGQVETLNIGTQTDPTDVELLGVTTKMISEVSPAEANSESWKVPYVKTPVFGATPLDQVSSIGYADERGFGLRFWYYHGLQQNAGGNLYPYASVDNTDYSGNVLTSFTLALNATGTSFSAVKKFYEFRKNSKPFEMAFLLGAMQFLQLRPQARVAVYDLNFATIYCLIDKLSADLGAKEIIRLNAQLYPIILRNNTVQITPDEIGPTPEPEPPYDNGTVYVKLQLRNIVNTPHAYPPPPYNTIDHDVYVLFFEDAGMATPKDVVTLPVRLRQSYYSPSGTLTPVTGDTTFTVTSAAYEKELLHQAPQFTNQGGTARTWAYELLPSTAYTIIP